MAIRSCLAWAAVAVFGAACSRGGPAPSATAAASDASAASVATDAAADAPEIVKLDIVYVPTPQAIVDRMLEVAKIQKTDVLYDLGCGDGRILVTAAKRYGAHAVGFEIAPKLVAEARDSARANGVEDLVTVRLADLMLVDLSPATVVTMYLSPRLQDTLVHHTSMMRPGSRVVTHDYALSDAVPTAKWSMPGPFFGNMNQLWEAGVPEDEAHYPFRQHYLFLYVTPLRFP